MTGRKGELVLVLDGREHRYRPGDWYHVPARAVRAARFEKETSEIEFWFYKTPGEAIRPSVVRRAHSHEEDDVFFVIEGTMSFLIGDRWIDAPTGSFVLAPAGVTHDFENRSSSRAGALNFSIPGDFEKSMPAIAEWFAENPPKDA